MPPNATQSGENMSEQAWESGAAPATATLAVPIVLIRGPRAQRSAKGEAARRSLAAAGVVIAEELEVSAFDHNLPRGDAWRARGYAAAVAAGGDGTIGAVATQLAGSGLPLGILPLGTSNDVARSLGIPLDLARAAEVIVRGTPTAVDAGRAVPAATEPLALLPERHGGDGHDSTSALEPGSRLRSGAYFLHALTLGLNAEFARLATDMARRRRWGRLNYAAAALEAVAHFTPLDVRVTLEGVRRWSPEATSPDGDGALTLECRVLQVAAVNLPVFGGALDLRLPQVELHDSLLDFVLIEAPAAPHGRETMEGWLEAVRRFHVAARAKTVVQSEVPAPATLSIDVAGFSMRGVHRYQARAATLATAQPVDVTLDGELRSRTPVRVEVAPAPVHVLLPRPSGAKRSEA
jgi:diacylglycerol kinase family enzyme